MLSRRSFALLGTSALFSLSLAEAALAATYTVTSTSVDPAVSGSLGWAISQANANAGADTIVFDTSLAGQTITLDRMLPIISDDVTIDGSSAAGLTISGGGTYNIFFIRRDGSDSPGSMTVTISDLTLEDGRAKGGDGGPGDGSGGGGMGAGGAIFVGKNVALTASNINFVDNSARGGNGGVYDNVTGFAGGGGGGGPQRR